MIGGGFCLAGVYVMVGWWWLMPCWGVCDGGGGGCYLVGHAWWRSGGCAGVGWFKFGFHLEFLGFSMECAFGHFWVCGFSVAR